MVLILLVGMMVPAHAAGTPTLSISSGSVKAGESVTLTVSIKDNPGISGTLVYLYFDDQFFSVDPDKDISLASGFNKGYLVANTIDGMRGGPSYDGLPGKDGVAVMWFDISGKDVTANGTFFQVTFHVDKDAANGDHTIGVGISADNTITFEQDLVKFSASNGKINVSGGDDEKEPTTSTVQKVEFTDISGHWAESYINQSSEAGLVQGFEGKYRPDDTMTRAEFVTILWRAMGEPKPSGKASFTDLSQDWYKDPVAWAEQNQVVNGMGDGLFDPNGKVTREQLVTILHRMSGIPSGMEMMFTSVYDGQYGDSGQIGSWAKNAMYWAIYNKIYCGTNSVEIGSKLYPKAPANRAQIAVMMTSYLNLQN